MKNDSAINSHFFVASSYCCCRVLLPSFSIANGKQLWIEKDWQDVDDEAEEEGNFIHSHLLRFQESPYATSFSLSAEHILLQYMSLIIEEA